MLLDYLYINSFLLPLLSRINLRIRCVFFI
jgi:hypothetical protein